jgi:hypothetical protein
MTKFIDTDAGEEFIASARSRETSREIMEAIAFFARNEEEALALWNWDGLGYICNLSDIWERVTHNGIRSAEDFFWGAAGPAWWREESCQQEVD